jgi:hypothetical protein
MLPGVAVTVPFVGTVVSRMIVSLTGVALVLFDWSRYQTFTAVVPLPDASVQFFVASNGAQLLHVAVLLMHIWIAPPLSSAAVSVNLDTAFRVAAAPSLIVAVPLGGVVSGGTGWPSTVAPVDMLPAASIAQIR